MRRNRKEEDLRENHPYFDCPMFFVPRESRFRRVCQRIVNARYVEVLEKKLDLAFNNVKPKDRYFVIIVSVQVLLVLTFGLWTLGLQTWA